MPTIFVRPSRTTRNRWITAVLVSASLHVSGALAAMWTFGSLRARPVLEQTAGRSGQIELQASLADWSQPLPMPEVTLPPPEVSVAPDHVVMADRTYRQTSTSVARPTPAEAVWVDEQLRPPPAPDVTRTRPEDQLASLARPLPPLPRRDRPPQIETVVRPSSRSLPATKVLGSGDMQTPRPKFDNRPPQYPPEAFAQSWEGTVALRLHVSAAGLVSRVDVVDSSGHDVLDAAAVHAARSWRFEPAYQAGRPLATTVRQNVRFRLR